MRRILFKEKARTELKAAKAWYASQATPAIAEELGREVMEFLGRVREFPDLYQEVRPGYRRVVLKRFPYSITYHATAELIVVISVVNQAKRTLET